MYKKNIYLIIVFSLFFSCAEPYLNVEYIVKNSTAYDIELHYFLFGSPNGVSIEDTVFNIQNNSEIKIKYWDSFGNSSYGWPLGGSSDSVYVTFDNDRRLIYYRESSGDKGILDIENYDENMLDKHNCEYTYTFTDEDYTNATEIK